MTEQLNHWHKCTMQRYDLYVHKVQSQTIKTSSNSAQANLNHPAFWPALRKISVHATSGKLLNNKALYSGFSLTLSCVAGGQTPQVTKSKRSVAAFKVMKHSAFGLVSHIRKDYLKLLCYKWTFLAPSANPHARKTTEVNTLTRSHSALMRQGFGVTNLFIFPELDKLDYYAFEPLPGIEVSFDHCFIKPRNKPFYI